MKEKYTLHTIISAVGIGENRIDTFNKRDELRFSFRVQEKGYLGVHFQTGEMGDEEGYAIARQNLALTRQSGCSQTGCCWRLPGRRWNMCIPDTRTLH